MVIKVHNFDSDENDLLNLKKEIEKLNLELEEKNFIIERTKEFLFILENKNEISNKQIDDLKKESESNINEIIRNKDNQIETLKRGYESEIHKVNEEKFIFSIIITIYNTEKYVSEAIDSVLNQLFNFNNVEIILVDDGSTDSSSEICKEYVNKYPNNIHYIYQKNQGLSISRNVGLKVACGKFVNFLDSYDKLEPNTLNEIFYHFNKFGDEIDIISMPRWSFGDFEGKMPFYNKYYKSRIVDINDEYDFPSIPTNSSFLRRSEALKFELDNGLVLSEDCHFMTKMVLEKGKFGVVDSIKYLCRKRFEEDSLDEVKKSNKKYFANFVEIYFNDLINYSIEKFGKVLKYVQSVLLYNFQCFLLQNTEVGVLDDNEIKNFHKTLHEIFQVIDDDIVLSQNFCRFIKFFILNIKYNYPGFYINGDDEIVLVNGVSFDKLSNNKIVIENVSSENEIIGHFKFYSEKININAFKNDKKLNLQIVDIEKEISISKVIYYKFNFKINLYTFNGLEGIKFELTYDSKDYPILFESKLVGNVDN